MLRFPHYRQLDAMDCGPACLRMIAKYFGVDYSLQFLREHVHVSKHGVSLEGIINAATFIGFRALGVRVTLPQLVAECPKPCVLYWNKSHFVVCYKIRKTRRGFRFYIADPAMYSCMSYSESEFISHWYSEKIANEDAGLSILFEPTSAFFECSKENKVVGGKSIKFLFKYVIPYKKQIMQLLGCMLLISGIQLIFPFLTQALVDNGIKDANLNLITAILIAQLCLFGGRMLMDFIRSRILLFVNTRINISLISDFLQKLMRLPLYFFDSKKIGDIMQRIGDHGRIETFLTGTSFSSIFSFFTFVVFSFVLAYYDWVIFFIFVIGNIFYVCWIIYFMKYRRDIDMKRFSQASCEQSNLLQLITGMQEIKLNNSEDKKRKQWENIQVKLFKLSQASLNLEQYQQLGSAFFNQTTNILISYIAARSVVFDTMTLGMMMSITYIVGQLNAPIEQLLSFLRSFQDAQISLERLNEIHCCKDEESEVSQKMNEIPLQRDIVLRHVCFSYTGDSDEDVLSDINLIIPRNKITAIVGASGSGKTTLIKLLLGFYEPQKGTVSVGNVSLNEINPHLWRSKIGVVLQDGYIFSDTVAENIAISSNSIDEDYLRYAMRVANIEDFIDSLPLKTETVIGMEGNGLSQGQRQRILIARAVYKNPEYIFLDEATNSLDANNEKEILENLQKFYEGKTVLIVAHRLSTVKNADKIVVLDKGKIVEEGTHSELLKEQGFYYDLVQNQLDIDL